MSSGHTLDNKNNESTTNTISSRKKLVNKRLQKTQKMNKSELYIELLSLKKSN